MVSIHVMAAVITAGLYVLAVMAGVLDPMDGLGGCAVGFLGWLITMFMLQMKQGGAEETAHVPEPKAEVQADSKPDRRARSLIASLLSELDLKDEGQLKKAVRELKRRSSDSEVTRLEETLRQSQEQQLQTKRELEALRKSKAPKDEQGKLKREIDAARKEASTLRGQLAEQTAVVERTEQELASARSGRTFVQQEAERLQVELQAALERADRAETAEQELSTRVDQLNTARVEWESRATSAERSLEEVSQQLARVQSTVSECEAAVRLAKTGADERISAALEAQRAAEQALEAERKKAANALRDAEQRLDSLRAQLTSTESERDSAQRSSAEAVTNVERLREQIATLEAQCDTTREQHATLQEELRACILSRDEALGNAGRAAAAWAVLEACDGEAVSELAERLEQFAALVDILDPETAFESETS